MRQKTPRRPSTSGLAGLLAVCAVFFLAGDAPGAEPRIVSASAPRTVSLFIPNHRQLARNWCWAAVAQQLLARRFDVEIPFQCELAGRAKGVSTQACCLGALACRGTASLTELAALLRREGAATRRLPSLDPLDLQAELARGRAVVVGLREAARPRHLVVVKGIDWIAGEAWLRINDPEGLRPSLIRHRDLARIAEAALSVD